MKKSLLVVPAMGVLLLAAAGSVGGTVAWFTSVSSVDAAVGKFQATTMDGNLAVVLTAITAKGTTQVVDSQSQPTGEIVVTDGAYLTHASFDHKASNQTIYTYSNDNSNKVRAVVDSTHTNWVAKDGAPEAGEKIYWAVSWTMAFTYAFATEESAYLFFNPNSTLINWVEDSEHPGEYVQQDITDNSTTHNTIKGFRIAFTTSDNDGNTRVWGKYRNANSGDNLVQAHHIYGEDSNFSNSNYGLTGTPYNGDFIGAEMNTFHAEGADLSNTDYSGALECLGVFNKPSNGTTDTITFTCVAWFEGTDPDVVSAATGETTVMNKVSASMKFYARENTYVAPANPEPAPSSGD